MEPRALNFLQEAAIETLGEEVKTIRGQLQIWNFYRPPAEGGLGTGDAELHLENWPVIKKVIRCADINAHGAWDKETDGHTRFRGKSRTAPDVTLVHASRMHLCNWVVGETNGADHIPISID